MTTTAWAHLPNAKHIDAVLAHVKLQPHKWDSAWSGAWTATALAAADRDAAWTATARSSSRDTALDDAWAKNRDVAWYAALDEAWATAADPGAAWDAARDASIALIAWDDCAELLERDPDVLRLMAACGHDAAVLLLPACIAMSAKDAPCEVHLPDAPKEQKTVTKNVGPMGYAMIRNGKQFGIELSYDAASLWRDAEMVPLYAARPDTQQREAEAVCADAYQVVGSLLADLDKFGTPEAVKILDNLSAAKLVHADVLPWPSYAPPRLLRNIGEHALLAYGVKQVEGNQFPDPGPALDAVWQACREALEAVGPNIEETEK